MGYLFNKLLLKDAIEFHVSSWMKQKEKSGPKWLRE